MSILQAGLEQLGFAGSDFSGIFHADLSQLEERMESYIALLQETNAKFDLINTDDHDEIVVRHILDSLSGAPLIAELIKKRMEDGGSTVAAGGEPGADRGAEGVEGATSGAKGAPADGKFSSLLIADIGSGAGLPGIPLAAAFPSVPFVLIERMTKRCAFLNQCIRELGLTNVTVEENQAERLEQNRFDIATFRAFRPLEKKMMKVLRRILKEKGKLAAYKAKSDKIKEEMEALGPAMPAYQVKPLTVPFLTQDTGGEEERQRNLVIIEK